VHRLLRAFAAIGGAALVILLTVAPAGAGTIVSPTAPFTAPNQDPARAPGPFPQDIGSFTINYSGFTPNQNVLAEQCDGLAPTAPGYSATIDCDTATEPAGVRASSTGAGTFPSYDINFGFYAFRGDSPSSLFTCLSPNQPAPVVTDPQFRNCQLKLTNLDTSAQSTDAFLTMTLAEPGAQIPETPIALLLPISAVLLLGGGYVVFRRRSRTISSPAS